MRSEVEIKNYLLPSFIQLETEHKAANKIKNEMKKERFF